MKAILYFTISTFLFYACKTTNDKISGVQIPNQGFQIEGSTNGLPEGTIIYLRNMDSFELLDSAIITDQRFMLSGHLDVEPLKVEIHTSDITQSNIFWIDNSHINFDASTNLINDAIITGSNANKAVQEINQKMRLEGGGRLPHELSFIRNNPANVYSPYALSKNAILWKKELTQELYDTLSVANKNSFYGKKVAHYLSLNQNVEIGSSFVDFKMATVDGSETTLSNELGAVTLLEFWASWCGPCRSENPNLKKTYEKYKNQGFKIVAVSLDHKKENLPSV